MQNKYFFHFGLLVTARKI